MKKTFITIPVLFLTLLLGACGNKKMQAETVTIPEPILEDITTEEPIIEETVIEESPSEEPVPEIEAPAPAEPEYPYWWELHDYNTDQEILLSDGEIKNLSLQPGNQPDELYITWFSRSSSQGIVTFDHTVAKAVTLGSISVPGYYRNSALITGLESNTTYTYHVSNGNSHSPSYTFETGDLYSTDFTFTIAGDPEIGLGDPEDLPGHRSLWKIFLNRMKTHIPNSCFIITTGDQIAKSDSTEHYDYF